MINIVLYEPSIAQNIGNIIRTCYALGAKLHIIKSGYFNFWDKDLIRASSNRKISDIEHEIHTSWSNFLLFHKQNGNYFYFLTSYGEKKYTKIEYKNVEKDFYIIFGNEQSGIEKNILNNYKNQTYYIPMTWNARSLNLSNSVAIIGYELKRQVDFINLIKK